MRNFITPVCRAGNKSKGRSMCTLSEVCADFNVKRQSVAKLLQTEKCPAKVIDFPWGDQKIAHYYTKEMREWMQKMLDEGKLKKIGA